MSRSAGEEAVERLIQPTFLRPWLLPNLYYEKGKELADFVIAFGDKLLIIEEKTGNFEFDIESNLLWQRWMKRIDNARKQTRRAEKILTSDKRLNLFTDSRCQNRIPEHFTNSKWKKIFRMVIVQGVSSHCARFFGDFPTLPIFSSHDCEAPKTPFLVNPFWEGEFYHVLDDQSARILFSLIDTAPELFQYLEKKQELFEFLPSLSVYGEEELVAHYMTNIDQDDHHGFGKIIEIAQREENNGIILDDREFRNFAESQALREKNY